MMVGTKRTSGNGWIPAAIAVAIIVAVGVYVARKAMQAEVPVASPSTASTTAVAAAPASAVTIHHPIAQAAVPAEASTAPLPALNDSDANVSSALIRLGGRGLAGLLVSQQVVERIVATVDALPRHTLGSTFILPLRTPQGSFRVRQSDGGTFADAGNASRYAPYMQVVDQADPKALVAWYAHNYPLFQQAYRELGYPKGYFNDRLVVAIDDMLAAPDLAQPAALTVVQGHYTYVDPALESLSVGQKLMLRLGPANEASLKTRLRSIRTLLTAQNISAASTAMH